MAGGGAREGPTLSNSPPEPLRKGANLFERLDYLVKAVLFLVIEQLNTRHQLEAMMATVQELQAALDANTAATEAASAAITTEIAQLQEAINALPPETPQALLDQLNASTAKLTAATAALAADDPAATG